MYDTHLMVIPLPNTTIIFQQDCETIPDLPRDSRQTTPAQSGGESSVEPSPVASRRKLSPKEKRQQDRDRFLTFTKEQEEKEEMTEEMEATLTQSRVSRLDDKAASGFRQSARALDDERFRTRTITKEELSSPSSSPEKQTSASSSSSSRSSKQRRADEASRFLTQTIGPGDLVRREEEEESMTAAALESEALRVAASLSELKAGRSRSQSAEILGESEMHDSREDLCRTREASRDLYSSRDSSRGGRMGSFDRSKSPAADADEGECMEKARPRVCKPWESRVQEQEVSSL